MSSAEGGEQVKAAVGTRSVRAVVLALLALVAWAGVTLTPVSADPLIATSIVLRLIPTGPVGTTTPVTFQATVTPSNAAGRVQFTFVQGGTATVVVDPANGVATTSSNFRTLGTQQVTAAFVPDNTSGFAPSTSSTQTLVVSTHPGISLAMVTGAPAAAGTAFSAGQRLQAKVEGFIPGTSAALLLDGLAVVQTMPITSTGAGAALFVLPLWIADGTHTLTARADTLAASMDLRSVTPARVAAPVPVASLPAAPTSAPVPAASQYTTTTTTTTTYVTGGQVAAVGSHGALAHTGAQLLGVVLAAAVLVLGGGWLMRVAPAGAPARGARRRVASQPRSTSARASSTYQHSASEQSATEATTSVSRADLRKAREEAAASAVAGEALSRADRRRQAEVLRKKQSGLRAALSTWWIYPLIALAAVCVFFGVRAAQVPLAPPGVHVTTPAPEN